MKATHSDHPTDPRNATTLRCNAVINGRRCGNPPFAVAPGTTDEYSDTSTLILVRRGQPARTWCRECWTRRFVRLQGTAPEAVS